MCRCGPFPPALGLLEHEDRMRKLVNAMVDGTFPLVDGLKAFDAAKKKGALKVQVVMSEESWRKFEEQDVGASVGNE